jgi:hypothetical protein
VEFCRQKARNLEIVKKVELNIFQDRLEQNCKCKWMATLQEFTLTCRGDRYSLFPDMKVIQNTITFAPLVHKLRNGKCAHRLLEGFLMVPKVKQEAPWFRRVMAWAHPNKQ